MADAIWLFFAVPQWYAATILAPFNHGILTLIPAAGIACLVIGTLLGAIKRRFDLLDFLGLPALSQVLLAGAGFMRGQVDGGTGWFVVGAFLALQLAIAAYLVVRLEGARIPALFLSLFSLSYALFASFVALMSFSDQWL